MPYKRWPSVFLLFFTLVATPLVLAQTSSAEGDRRGLATSIPGDDRTPGEIRSLAVDPTNSETLYAGTAHGMLKSTDGGRTWTAANSGIGNTVITSIAVDPRTPATVYAGTWLGLFKSIDGGTSWTNTGTRQAVFSLVMDPDDARVLYVGARDGAGILATRDSGHTWKAINDGLPSTESGIEALAIASTHPATLYAGLYAYGIFKRGDRKWRGTELSHRQYHREIFIHALAVDPHTPTTLYALLSSSGVMKSVDGGRSWKPMNHGLNLSDLLESLVIDPTTPTTLYLGTGKGIFKTTDGALTWTPTGFEFTGTLPYLFLPLVVNPDHVLFAGPGRGLGPRRGIPFQILEDWKHKRGSVFRTIDGGTTWMRLADFNASE